MISREMMNGMVKRIHKKGQKLKDPISGAENELRNFSIN
jgi:hypothetical protein